MEYENKNDHMKQINSAKIAWTENVDKECNKLELEIVTAMQNVFTNRKIIYVTKIYQHLKTLIETKNDIKEHITDSPNQRSESAIARKYRNQQ